MPRFIALTSRGCVDVLLDELKSMGLENLEKTPGGVYFQGPWSHCYRANLQSRIATRVLLTILDFPAYNPEDLYNNIRKHDFTKYIDPQQTIAVDSSTNSEIFRDQRFVALKVKDAIVDQFREKFDIRPDVDSKNADLVINVRVQDSFVNVGIDTSGSALFRRGYREEQVDAPLKEHLGAALIRMTEWNG
jgi:putative N6-adenine-specific DNA methylase